jgi:hypothetical protein
MVAISWEVILQLSGLLPLNLKGVPLNIQTKTVVTIHNPVTGYCLKQLLVIHL